MRFWSIFISNFRGNSRNYAVVAVSIYCLVIYPMSGNNATLRIDFTDFDSTDSTEKIKFRSQSFWYTGSEMMQLLSNDQLETSKN